MCFSKWILTFFHKYCPVSEWEQFAAENEKLGKTHTEMLAMSYGNPPAPLGMRMTTFFNLRNNFLRPTLKNHHVLDANIKFSEYIKYAKLLIPSHYSTLLNLSRCFSTSSMSHSSSPHTAADLVTR